LVRSGFRSFITLIIATGLFVIKTDDKSHFEALLIDQDELSQENGSVKLLKILVKSD